MTSRIGLLVMSYGTARGPDDVEAYYTHVRRGRPPPPELLARLRRRYEAIGGRSPLIEITEAQAKGLEAELAAAAEVGVRAYVGMKHQRPYLEDAVRTMAADGVRRAVGIVMAPHYSRFSVGEYVERAGGAAEEAGVAMGFVESWGADPGFVRFVGGRVREALDRVPEALRDEAVVVFSAHSLPERILDSGDPYPDQLRETAELVAAEVGTDRFVTAWQSAGQTGEAWLGPDVTDVLRRLDAEGRRAAVSCPVGFVADHLEVLYDIDVEAQAAAREAGIALVRTESPNADPAFVKVLADVVRAHLENLEVA
jgi:ferrochelatase